MHLSKYHVAGNLLAKYEALLNCMDACEIEHAQCLLAKCKLTFTLSPGAPQTVARFQEAIQHVEKLPSFSLQERILSELYSRMAWCQLNCQAKDDAFASVKKALNVISASSISAPLAQATGILGLILNEGGHAMHNLQGAEEKLREALQMWQSLAANEEGPFDREIAEARFRLARSFLYPEATNDPDRLTEAESLLHSALQVNFVESAPRRSQSVQASGAENKEVAQVHLHLGLVYAAQGRYLDARAEHIRFIEMISRLFGADHASLMQGFTYVGDTYSKSGEHDSALLWHKKRLDLATALHQSGESPLQAVAFAWWKMTSAEERVGNWKGCIAAYTKVLEVCPSLLDDDEYRQEHIEVVAKTMAKVKTKADCPHILDAAITHARKILEITFSMNDSKAPEYVGKMLEDLCTLCKLKSDDACLPPDVLQCLERGVREGMNQMS